MHPIVIVAISLLGLGCVGLVGYILFRPVVGKQMVLAPVDEPALDTQDDAAQTEDEAEEAEDEAEEDMDESAEVADDTTPEETQEEGEE